MERPNMVPAAIVLLFSLLAGVLLANVDNTLARALLGVVVALATVAGAFRAAALGEAGAAAPALTLVPSDDEVRVFRQDRRNPILDRASGLFTDWYLRLRLEEEIARAERYGQRFSVVTVASDTPIDREVTRSIGAALRHVDYAANLGPAVAIVLPNTNADGAAIWRDRLELAESLDVRINEFPTAGKTVAALLGEDSWAWPASQWSSQAS